jgi:hypothetical protein
VAANNVEFGVALFGDGSSPTNLFLTRFQVLGNTSAGLKAQGANTAIWLSQSTVSGNASGFNISGGAIIESNGDNTLAVNGANTGSLSVANKQ